MTTEEKIAIGRKMHEEACDAAMREGTRLPPDMLYITSEIALDLFKQGGIDYLKRTAREIQQ